MQNSKHGCGNAFKYNTTWFYFRFHKIRLSIRETMGIECAAGSLQRKQGVHNCRDSRWLWVAFLCWVRSPGFTNSADFLTRCESSSLWFFCEFFCNFPLFLATLGNFQLRLYFFPSVFLIAVKENWEVLHWIPFHFLSSGLCIKTVFSVSVFKRWKETAYGAVAKERDPEGACKISTRPIAAMPSHPSPVQVNRSRELSSWLNLQSVDSPKMNNWNCLGIEILRRSILLIAGALHLDAPRRSTYLS